MAVEELPQPELSDWLKMQSDRLRSIKDARRRIEDFDIGIGSYAIGPFIFNRFALRRGISRCYRACEIDLVTAVIPDQANGMSYAEQIDAETGEMRRCTDPVGKRLALKIASNDSNGL